MHDSKMGLSYAGSSVSIEFASPVQGLSTVSRLYIRSERREYSDTEASVGESSLDGDTCVTRFRMVRADTQKLLSMRVDPVECSGLCRIREVRLCADGSRTIASWGPRLLDAMAYNVNAVVLSAPEDDEYTLWSLHDDPHFELDISRYSAELANGEWLVELRWGFEPIDSDESLRLAQRLLDGLKLADAVGPTVPSDASTAYPSRASSEHAQISTALERYQEQALDNARGVSRQAAAEWGGRLLRAGRRFSKRLERRHQATRSLVSAVAERLDDAQRNAADQSARIHALEADLAVLHERLAKRNIAARLRNASGRLLRNLQSRLDYFRTFHLTVGAASGIDRDDAGDWTASGTDPSLELLIDGGRTLTAGWYLFTSNAKPIGDSVLVDPCFYADYGQGMSEATRLPLHLNAGDQTSLLVRFAGDVVRLRLDPSISPCRFALSTISLRKLTSSEVMLRLAAPVMRGRWFHLPTLLAVAVQMLRLLFTQGRAGVRSRLVDLHASVTTVSSGYRQWVAQYDTLRPDDREAMRKRIESLPYAPLVSIVMPVYETPEIWLRRCIDTVIAQIYPHWELCIADDASPSLHVRKVLEEYASKDARIRFVVREVNGHISASSNSALELARGDYVVLLDHDDELSEHALYHVVEALNQEPRPKLLYSDEDKIDESGVRFDPYFKTEWNPDLFRGHNMISHLGVYERRMLEEVGGFRLGFEGSQDYDLALRCIERLGRHEIHHIPRVLYHWRAIAGSTALGPQEKNYAHVAACKSIKAHLDRIGLAGDVSAIERHAGNWRLSYTLESMPRVAVIVPTRNGLEYLRRCIESMLRNTTYPNYRIVVVDNQSDDPQVHAYFDALRESGSADIIAFDEPFNFSRLNNVAARSTDSDFLIFLNNDTEIISPGWIEELVSLAQRPGVGAVGAMLYYPNDTIQHAGILLGVGADRIAGHAYHLKPRGYPGDKCRARLVQEVSAVTAACLAIKRDRFESVGGFDETLAVAFNDVDFCLRLMEGGYHNLWTPNAELYHFESITRGSDMKPERRERYLMECAAMRKRWGARLTNDPYYHPALSLDGNDFLTQVSPRLPTPWRSESEKP
jgi:O-antigen biosynthesis protein